MSQLPDRESAARVGASAALAPCDETLLDQLVAGALGPLSRLRDSIDLTLEQVSEWIVQPDNRQRISNLVTLLDAQTQLIICQQRLLAVARLVEVARSAPAYETVRRACADLLKIRLVDPYREDKRPIRMPPPRPIDELAILEALEHLGRDEEAPPDAVECSDPARPAAPRPAPRAHAEPLRSSCARAADSADGELAR